MITLLNQLPAIDSPNFKRISSNFGHKLLDDKNVAIKMKPVDGLPLFGNLNRDCAHKRLDRWLLA